MDHGSSPEFSRFVDFLGNESALGRQRFRVQLAEILGIDAMDDQGNVDVRMLVRKALEGRLSVEQSQSTLSPSSYLMQDSLGMSFDFFVLAALVDRIPDSVEVRIQPELGVDGIIFYRFSGQEIFVPYKPEIANFLRSQILPDTPKEIERALQTFSQFSSLLEKVPVDMDSRPTSSLKQFFISRLDQKENLLLSRKTEAQSQSQAFADFVWNSFVTAPHLPLGEQSRRIRPVLNNVDPSISLYSEGENQDRSQLTKETYSQIVHSLLKNRFPKLEFQQGDVIFDSHGLIDIGSLSKIMSRYYSIDTEMLKTLFGSSQFPSEHYFSNLVIQLDKQLDWATVYFSKQGDFIHEDVVIASLKSLEFFSDHVDDIMETIQKPKEKNDNRQKGFPRVSKGGFLKFLKKKFSLLDLDIVIQSFSNLEEFPSKTLPEEKVRELLASHEPFSKQVDEIIDEYKEEKMQSLGVSKSTLSHVFRQVFSAEHVRAVNQYFDKNNSSKTSLVRDFLENHDLFSRDVESVLERLDKYHLGQRLVEKKWILSILADRCSAKSTAFLNKSLNEYRPRSQYVKVFFVRDLLEGSPQRFSPNDVELMFEEVKKRKESDAKFYKKEFISVIQRNFSDKHVAAVKEYLHQNHSDEPLVQQVSVEIFLRSHGLFGDEEVSKVLEELRKRKEENTVPLKLLIKVVKDQFSFQQLNAMNESFPREYVQEVDMKEFLLSHPLFSGEAENILLKLRERKEKHLKISKKVFLKIIEKSFSSQHVEVARVYLETHKGVSLQQKLVRDFLEGNALFLSGDIESILQESREEYQKMDSHKDENEGISKSTLLKVLRRLINSKKPKPETQELLHFYYTFLSHQKAIRSSNVDFLDVVKRMIIKDFVLRTRAYFVPSHSQTSLTEQLKNFQDFAEEFPCAKLFHFDNKDITAAAVQYERWQNALLKQQDPMSKALSLFFTLQKDPQSMMILEGNKSLPPLIEVNSGRDISKVSIINFRRFLERVLSLKEYSLQDSTNIVLHPSTVVVKNKDGTFQEFYPDPKSDFQNIFDPHKTFTEVALDEASEREQIRIFREAIGIISRELRLQYTQKLSMSEMTEGSFKNIAGNTEQNFWDVLSSVLGFTLHTEYTFKSIRNMPNRELSLGNLNPQQRLVIVEFFQKYQMLFSKVKDIHLTYQEPSLRNCRGNNKYKDLLSSEVTYRSFMSGVYDNYKSMSGAVTSFTMTHEDFQLLSVKPDYKTEILVRAFTFLYNKSLSENGEAFLTQIKSMFGEEITRNLLRGTKVESEKMAFFKVFVSVGIAFVNGELQSEVITKNFDENTRERIDDFFTEFFPTSKQPLVALPQEILR